MMSIPKVTLQRRAFALPNETQGGREKRREKVKTVRTGPGLCKALRGGGGGGREKMGVMVLSRCDGLLPTTLSRPRDQQTTAICDADASCHFQGSSASHLVDRASSPGYIWKVV